MTTSRTFADHLASLPPSAGTTILVGIDGFSGAGKTALAGELAEHEDVTVVSIEEFYLGWEGLAAAPGRVLDGLVAPLRRGGTPCWRPWDWEHEREGPEQERPVTTRVVALEGCGAGARSLRHHHEIGRAHV